jgi:hypothetical protein
VKGRKDIKILPGEGITKENLEELVDFLNSSNDKRKSYYPKSIKELKVGYINFNAKREMKLGILETVNAEIFLNEDLIKDIPEKYNIDQIHITKKMKAKLTSKDLSFEITPLNSETQVILDDDKTVWNWDIKPVKHGLGVLELVLSAAIAVEDMGFEMKDFETYRRDVFVKVNRIYSTKKFMADNWQWAVGLVVGSGVAFQLLKEFVSKKP